MSVRLIVPLLLCAVAGDVQAQVEVVDASLEELQAALESGSTTSVQLTRAYLRRIAAYDRAGPSLNSIVTINPMVLDDAATADEERARGIVRSALHGIPVIVKDNVDVAGLPTSAGSLALIRNIPSSDAALVRQLRQAGALILAKANMHELASGVTTVSSVAGQTHNPYDPTRTPGGSSGGTAVAVASSFAAIGWGTDTCGSIRIPAAHNALFALRPTRGLTSMAGVLPLSRSHDVVAPMARTVTDLALGLDLTTTPHEGSSSSFRQALKSDAFQGVRVGVLNEFFHGTGEDLASQWIQVSLVERLLNAGEGVTALDLSDLEVAPPYVEHPDEVEPVRLTRLALARLTDMGADTVHVAIPDLVSLIRGTSMIDLEFRDDLNAYLAVSAGGPIRTLRDLLATELLPPALERQLSAREQAGEESLGVYSAALARRERLRVVLDSVFDAFDVDVLAYPSVRRIPAAIGEVQRGSTCGLSSNSGWPAMNIPVGLTEDGLPVGMELLAREYADEMLVGMAYAFEQRWAQRETPWSVPPLRGGEMPGPIPVHLDPAAGQPLSAFGPVSFSLRPALNLLEYRWTVPNLRDDAVIDVTLRVPRRDGGARMVHLLEDVGSSELVGGVTLSPSLRRFLDQGQVSVHITTMRHPEGLMVGRLSVSPF